MPTKPSLAERVKHDPELLKRALANAGLRSKLPSKYLSPEQRQQRKTNIRLKQPIVAGSTITEGALAQESKANMDVAYGPTERAQQAELGKETQRATDIGGWYDQYLRTVAQHSQNIRDIGAQATAAGTALTAGINGINTAGLQGIQNPAVADAASRGAVAGDLSGVAGNAATVRQALLGSFLTQQTGQNAASQVNASNLAGVVAPGQKLQAQAQQLGRIRGVEADIKGTATDRGQKDFAYRADRRTEEARNVLAERIAGDKVDIAENTATTKVKIEKAKAKERAKHDYGPGGSKQNSFGYTYDEWNGLKDADRTRIRERKAAGKPPEDTLYTSGAFAGKHKSEIEALTPKARQKLIDAYDEKHGAGDPDKPKTGPDFLPTGEANAGISQLGGLKDLVKKAKTGAPFAEGHGKQKPLSYADAIEKVRKNAASAKHPALITAAADAIFHGYIQASTVRALITAGYKPSVVAGALGVKTSGEVKASDPKAGRNG